VLEKTTRAAERELLVHYIAENACRVIYNEAMPPDPFDEDSGAWFTKCVLDLYVAELDSREFEKAWGVLTNGE
jgi:hypothetical protein